LNVHYSLSYEEFSYIIEAIKLISEYGYLFLSLYKFDITSGEWSHVDAMDSEIQLDLDFDRIINIEFEQDSNHKESDNLYKKHIEDAKQIVKELFTDYKEPEYIKWDEDIEKGAFFYVVNARKN